MLAVSVLGWILRSVIAVAAAVGIYVLGAAVLAKFKISPPAEVDPEEIVAVDAQFRCIVCGAEVTMTASQQGEEIVAPRHCREDMVPVGV